MSWLFWILLIVFVVCVIQGYRKGMIRTAISMVSFIIVLYVTSWISPYVGDFIRENTNWEQSIQEKCADVIEQGMEQQPDLSVGSQVGVIEELPLPQSMKEKLLENNNSEVYKQLAVESFADYLSGYISYGIINGIAFLIAFIITNIIVKLILYAVDLLTELPVVGTLNRLGGILLGGVQGILWIWIFFLVITLLYETSVGSMLMDVTNGDPVLRWLYDRDILVQVIMKILV
ncbi:MAG: CvpA family protein [Clostridia bacterium]|nr:CvpA family protein [Clostridia bacterium]NCC42402.1 CvpA family protein [Clostridia bacterium]